MKLRTMASVTCSASIIAGCALSPPGLDQPANASFVVKRDATALADCAYLELRKSFYTVTQAKLESLGTIEIVGETADVKHFVVDVKRVGAEQANVEFRIRPYSNATGLTVGWLRDQIAECL